MISPLPQPGWNIFTEIGGNCLENSGITLLQQVERWLKPIANGRMMNISRKPAKTKENAMFDVIPSFNLKTIWAVYQPYTAKMWC